MKPPNKHRGQSIDDFMAREVAKEMIDRMKRFPKTMARLAE